MAEARRLKLHELLVEALGSRNVYFEPPETIKMKYPCIVYTRAGGNSKFSNDYTYKHDTRYTVTVIDYDPDSEIGESLLRKFLKCSYDRHFSSENLSHDVYTIFY